MKSVGDYIDFKVEYKTLEYLELWKSHISTSL